MRTFFLKVGLLCLLLCSFAVMAVDAPPSLANHQFYGTVYWDANETVPPTQVDAEVLGTTVSSVLAEVSCPERVCSATYGKSPDNILRVQGSAGLEVMFFLGDREVTRVPYVDYKVEELDLNIATVPVTCTPEPVCSEWTDCFNTKYNRSCYDTHECGSADTWNKTEVQACGAETHSPRSRSDSTAAGTGASGTGGCTQAWQCSLWSLCVGSEQRRSCSRSDVCGSTGVVVPKPEESKSCAVPVPSTTGSPIPSVVASETCFDGILNQAERGIDCGGECKPCPEKKVTSPSQDASSSSGSLLIFGLAALGVIVVGLVVFLIIHKKKVAAMGGGSSGSSRLAPSVMSQLDGAYAKGELSGLSRSDVTQKLIEKGWDAGTLEEYLTKR